MINIVALFFSLSRHHYYYHYYYYIIIIVICSIQIAIIYMYNAGAVPRRAVCIATTVIIRVRTIDTCSSEHVYVSRDTSSRGLTSRPSRSSRVSPDTADLKVHGTRKVATVSPSRISCRNISINSGTNPKVCPRQAPTRAAAAPVQLAAAPVQIAFSII